MNRKQFLSALIIAPVAACFKKAEANVPVKQYHTTGYCHSSTLTPEYGQYTLTVDGIDYCIPDIDFKETYETTIHNDYTR